jgi:uncharacterized protein YndB with AHSA1/START domain
MSAQIDADAIVEEITIAATATRVFTALTDPQQRVKWWGQRGRFETSHAESDLRPGGHWLMRGSGIGGRPFHVGGEYRIVEPPRVLAFTWLPDWDENATETLVRFDLHEHDGVTTVRLTHSGFASARSRERHLGWPQILSWLKAYVRG